jgi:hypothetical protein
MSPMSPSPRGMHENARTSPACTIERSRPAPCSPLETPANPATELRSSNTSTPGLCSPGSAVSAGTRPVFYNRGWPEGSPRSASLKDQSLAGNTTYQEAASQVVSAILADAAADASGRTGQALSDVLPRLAEAAPSEFLDDFDTTSPLLRTMFQDDQILSLMRASASHSGLLWALEVVCWSSDYLGLSTLALAAVAVARTCDNLQISCTRYRGRLMHK